jgi:hypothetical protein
MTLAWYRPSPGTIAFVMPEKMTTWQPIRWRRLKPPLLRDPGLPLPCHNTQEGPKRNPNAQVLGPWGPIPKALCRRRSGRFGFMYQSGGNLGECLWAHCGPSCRTGTCQALVEFSRLMKSSPSGILRAQVLLSMQVQKERSFSLFFENWRKVA